MKALCIAIRVVLISESSVGGDVWLFVTFARVAVEEDLPFLEGEIIVPPEFTYETSADDTLVGAQTFVVASSSIVGCTGLAKVSMAAGGNGNVGDAVAGSGGSDDSLSIPVIPGSPAQVRVSSSQIVVGDFILTCLVSSVSTSSAKGMKRDLEMAGMTNRYELLT